MNTALVWGASGGIGSAMVRVLKEEQWRVFAVARNTDNIPTVADEKLHFEATDTASFRDVNFTLASDSDGVDLMIYAAGSLVSNKIAKLDHDDWIGVLNSNLTGAFLATQHSISTMKPDGHIVFIGAYIDHITLPKMAAYTVAKAGLDPLVQILRKENRKMRFSIVRPGAVDTDFWDNAPFRKPENFKSPDTIARSILEHYLSGNSTDLNL